MVLAEDMLQKHRSTKASTRGKGTAHKARKPATKAPAKTVAKKKPAPKKK